MQLSYTINIPIFLTLIRLVVSPILLPFLLVHFLPFNDSRVNFFLGLLFVFFSLTDFFDGYLARKLRQETLMGKILDPLADKFLTFSVLISLLACNKIYFFWVVILIGREFFVMGLRQLALQMNCAVHVSKMGKIKTAIQMAYLTVAIMNPCHLDGRLGSWIIMEFLLLAATLSLSIISALHYYYDCIKQIGSSHNTMKVNE